MLSWKAESSQDLILDMFTSENLEQKMTPPELSAWHSFKDIVLGVLGKTKQDNYREIVDTLIRNYQRMGCRMSIKMHYLYSHLDFFSDNMGDISDEHGERFHQDIEMMEKRYQGVWDEAMMGDGCNYVWNIVREPNFIQKKMSCSYTLLVILASV